MQTDTFFVLCPVFDFEPMIRIPRANPDTANDLLVPTFSQMSLVLESKIWPEWYYSEKLPRCIGSNDPRNVTPFPPVTAPHVTTPFQPI